MRIIAVLNKILTFETVVKAFIVMEMEEYCEILSFNSSKWLSNNLKVCQRDDLWDESLNDCSTVNGQILGHF